MEATQTICAACRSALEEQVLSARAADFPALFHNVVRNAPEPRRSPVDPTSIDMLKVAENTSDDIDLVPLVPMDDVRKSAPADNGSEPALATAASTASATAVQSAPTVPLAGETAVAPAPRPAQTAYTQPVGTKLEPTSSYKHVIIAVGSLVAAAVLAAILWSVLVPSRQDDGAGDAPAKTPAPTPAARK